MISQIKPTWNPDKSEGYITNAERAAIAESCLLVKKYCDEKRENITDLISDLLHLCDREGLDAEEIVDNAKMHWEAER